jgi:hypothetical protein
MNHLLSSMMHVPSLVRCRALILTCLAWCLSTFHPLPFHIPPQVPRKAKEAIGAIAKLTHADGSSMTINVEYNQLDPLLRATINPQGDVNDITGMWGWCGGKAWTGDTDKALHAR